MNMNFMEKVNKDYIVVVAKQSNNVLEFKKEKISNDYADIIDRLQEMKENPNRTVLDMQGCFTRVFNQKDYFHLCLPYCYSSSYVDGIRYPDMLTFDEYNTKLIKKRTKLKEKQLSDDKIEEKLDTYKRELKDDFLYECRRYIEGYNFAKTSSKIKNRSETVMLSTENIGWTKYEYKANEDVIIFIYTNFGYGNSSYFFLGMQYKGIDILPYSAIVHYYNADIIELKRHTRQYFTERDSWNIAFDFVIKSANMAKTDPRKFINEFVINEVREMVSGLKNIANQPNTEISRFINKRRNVVSNGFCYSVRNIWESEVNDYEVYRDEMNIAFKAEKVTGALLFLDKLSELAELLPTIQESIKEIKLLNNALIPELEEKIFNIQNVINEQNKKVESLEKSLKTLNEKMQPHEDIIQKLQETCKEQEEKNEVKKKYKIENHEYEQLCLEKEGLLNSISALKGHIQKRSNFIARLKECQNRIQTHLLAA